MTILGNILLLIACLIVFALNTGALAKAPPGGDAGVGYAWSLIILNLAFVIVMILATILIGLKDGFDWVSPTRSTRIWVVSLTLVAVLFTVAMSIMSRHEGGPVPALIKVYSHFVPVAIPLVMIAAGFILLNKPLRGNIPAPVYIWPLVIVAILGVTGAASGVIGFITQSNRNRAAIIDGIRRDNDENHQRMLADIDSNDVMKDMVFILVFTGDNQDPEIRARSVAKVKTHPQWQQELIRILETDWAPEALQFLASNDVDDPSLFLEPVRTGVLTQARLIRESIRNASHSSHFYPEQFTWEVERVLRTVDRFAGKGVDYTPAVREVREAFNESSEFEKPKWHCLSMLDKWLAKSR